MLKHSFAALAATSLVSLSTSAALAHVSLVQKEAAPSPLLSVAAATGGSQHAHHGADQASVGALGISEAWARAMLPGQPTGGAYMMIRNDAEEADTLVSVSSPIAGKVEIHTMEMKDDVMVMRPLVGGLEIPAGDSVALAPGGLHLMFMQVREPFAEGGEVLVTLEFEKAGTVELSLPVRPANTGRGGGTHQH